MRVFLARTWGLWLMVLLQVLFWQVPQIDLWVSGLFFEPVTGTFPLNDNVLVAFSYDLFKDAHIYYVGAIVWLFIASATWGGRGERPLRLNLAFLLIVWVLGPALLINEVIKAESGRARPRDVVEFAGTQPFTPAFEPADNCERNCSFVSSHAGMAYFLLALAWPLGDRRLIWYGLLLGGLVGLGRVMQGGHFLSDVIFSFWLVYGTSAVVARLILGRWQVEPAR